MLVTEKSTSLEDKKITLKQSYSSRSLDIDYFYKCTRRTLFYIFYLALSSNFKIIKKKTFICAYA